jgi:hypothetical protein
MGEALDVRTRPVETGRVRIHATVQACEVLRRRPSGSRSIPPLREELRIAMRRIETYRPPRVTRRREPRAQTVVEHIARAGDESNPYPEEHRYGQDSHWFL